MNFEEAIQALTTAGTDQNRKVYRRHGVTNEMFGVSFANLDSLKKKIKVDHEVAVRLWTTCNHDAQVLAAKIADPEQMTSRDLDAWAKELGNYVVVDAFSGLVSRSLLALQKMESWSRATDEWTAQAGWNPLACLAMKNRELADDFFEARLAINERNTHASKNRVRHAMNNALIAIGIRNASLQAQAIATARRIGKVEVDHGETGCQTPDAVQYILKTAARKRKLAVGS